MDIASSNDKGSQLTFLAADEAEREAVHRALLDKVEENLALIREIAALYNLPRLKQQRPRVMGPGEAAKLLAPEMESLEQEQIRVMVLNSKNEVLSIEMVYQGNVSAAIVRVGELFREAVRRNGSAVIVAHNHPSGSPNPSPEDLNLTREVVKAGALLGINVVDHLVIGQGGQYRSLREAGADAWKGR